jgi:DNA-binding transcriptional LysR family regulator
MESLDLNLLLSLDALLQEGSVTRAAQRVGLSTPAMSHALSRIRAQLEDPILVRSGRSMLLTPRAEGLKPRVHSLLQEARQTLTPEKSFVPKTLHRSFLILATDYVLSMLGFAVDQRLRAEAPGVSLRFIPNTPNDGAILREGGADLAIGIYAELPQEMRSRQLLTDRLVCVARKDHPKIGKRLSLEEFIKLEHIQTAPRGQPGGYLDDTLEEKGYSRRVARALPFFLPALYLTSRTDYLLTISERIATQMAPILGLKIFEPPLALRPYALSLVWHPRFDGDAAHRFLREIFIAASREVAGDAHSDPRIKLEPKKRRR